MGTSSARPGVGDAPTFHSVHFPSSFYPREAQPGVLLAEDRLGAGVIAALEARGHTVRRFAKPTFTKPAPIDLRHEITTTCDVVIEALAD